MTDFATQKSLSLDSLTRGAESEKLYKGGYGTEGGGEGVSCHLSKVCTVLLFVSKVTLRGLRIRLKGRSISSSSSS